MAVNREKKVEESVQVYAKAALIAKGWDEARLEFLESFPYDTFDGDLAAKSYLAWGFNFDDEGTAAELGSDLLTRVYTLEFFVFGRNEDIAEAIANDLKFAIDTDSAIPVLEIGEPNPAEIGSMLVAGVKAAKVLVDDPDSHQQHVWLTTARVEDEYFSSEA